MKHLAVILIVPFLFACTKEELALPSQALQGGVWRTGCMYLSSSMYEADSVYFTAGNFVQTQVAYADAYCSVSALRIEVTGSYTVSNSSTNIMNSRGDLDWKLATITVTLTNSAVVTQYNSSAFCGYSNWVLNVPKNVAGLTCGGSVMSNAGDMSYDIFSIATMSNSQLGIYEGDMNFGYNDSTYDGLTPATRPVATNGGRTFRRYAQ